MTILQVHLLKPKKCKECGKTLSENRPIYCRSCAKKGKRNPMFGKISSRNKGGHINKKLGYRTICVGKKNVYEHRLIMEKHLGRKLKRNEIIHHKNGNKLDNRIENLKLMTGRKHQKLHHKGKIGKRKGKIIKCIVCEKEFYIRPSWIKKGTRFCSNKCRGNYFKGKKYRIQNRRN